MSFRSVLVLAIAGIVWSCVLGLQRPAPSYSMESMPKTDFSCRNKIIGSYYADPETDCQLFHVCVSVAGSVQDYRFLCPNDTAFDQESQTCAAWYDVACEAATLYYASDNFDLYRLGSGLESLHYDSIRNDAEPQDHLQRSESNDPVRSAANYNNNNYNNNNYNNNNNNNKDILRGSSSSNFYNRNGKDDQDYNDKPYREEPAPEPPKKKTGVRKIARKQQYYSNNNNNNNAVTATFAPSTAAPTTDNYKYNTYNHRSTYQPTSTVQPDFTRRQNQQYTTPTTTFRPPTQSYSTYSAPSTTARTNYNSFNPNYNSNTPGAYGQVPTTVKPEPSNQGTQSQTAGKPNYRTQERFDKFSFDQRSTTLAPSTNYRANEYTNYRNYNNVQRSTSSPFPSTTAATTYEAYTGNNNQYRANSARQGPTQTIKYYNNYSGNYAPTTYSPKSDGASSRTTERPYQLDKNSQAKSTQFYDSTKAPKVTPGSFDATNSGKYFETSTAGYDFARSQSAIGFSPASINLLAETPKTTPAPRRSAPTTYNPSSYRASQSTTARPLVSSARPFSTTTADATTSRPKKNDYDYAYYDNAGALEYEGLDLENVARNKESAKISRA